MLGLDLSLTAIDLDDLFPHLVQLALDLFQSDCGFVFDYFLKKESFTPSSTIERHYFNSGYRVKAVTAEKPQS